MYKAIFSLVLISMMSFGVCNAQKDDTGTSFFDAKLRKDTCYTRIYSDSIFIMEMITHDVSGKNRTIDRDTFIVSADRKKWAIMFLGKKHIFWYEGRKVSSEIPMCKGEKGKELCFTNTLVKETKDMDNNTVYEISFKNFNNPLVTYYFNPNIGILIKGPGELGIYHHFVNISL